MTVRAVSEEAATQHKRQDQCGARLTEVSTKLSKLAETELANHTAKSKEIQVFKSQLTDQCNHALEES
jgi:hypothetical protein